MTINGINPLVPDDTRFFNIVLTRGRTLAITKFLGLADLGTDTESWKDTNTKQMYETDGDNYLDLCLRMAPTDNLDEITAVSIQAGAVFPPRGTGPNIAHMVAVTKMEKDGVYPHNLEFTPFSEKLFDVYIANVFEILSIAGTAGAGIVLIPLLGFGLGTGLMFLQSFFPTIEV